MYSGRAAGKNQLVRKGWKWEKRGEICIADIAVRESAMPWKEEEGAKNGSEREEAQFMRFILASEALHFSYWMKRN